MHSDINKFRDIAEAQIVDKDSENVHTVKSTINQFIGLIRAIFDADACYLYLINYSMDDLEKKACLEERIKEIENAYLERKLDFPPELKSDDIDAKILKFIDIAEKSKEKKWNLDYKDRPRKYVVYTKYDQNKNIIKEGITAYLARSRNLIILDTADKIVNHPSAANLNTRYDIAPECDLLIGIPLFDGDNVIGVLKVEKYNRSDKSTYPPDNPDVQKALASTPLLVQLIKMSKEHFEENSYDELFGGMNLLDNLKELKENITKSEKDVNEKIYYDTLNLFYELKGGEYIGYEEILDRVIEYIYDISTHLDLSEEIQFYNKFLTEFKKHEELLLYGLNDYRDHFMHQFHVFIIGYIIINKLDIEHIRKMIELNMELVYKLETQCMEKESLPDKCNQKMNTWIKNFEISKEDVLRIWFLTSFYHDFAYILEKIDDEISGFLKNVLGSPFSVKFNWEQLLKEESKFPNHLFNLVKFFVTETGTNQDTLLANYLDAIIESHDHGVLSALLLINNNSSSTQKRVNECLYAGLAISFHNHKIYEKLTEGYKSEILFESFPIAFLLAYCDTAQSFGRLEKKNNKRINDYPVKFSDIIVNKETTITYVTYKLKYTDSKIRKTPTAEQIRKWANGVNKHFKSKSYCFEIKYYNNQDRRIYELGFH